ncbi:MAG: ATP-binding protein [Adlercreutzia equolifaciens]
MLRKIIHIDEDKCIGCGLCVDACHEGAIAMVDGKARLMRDDYCDGLGDCLPSCPTDAISFVEREAAPTTGCRGGTWPPATAARRLAAFRRGRAPQRLSRLGRRLIDDARSRRRRLRTRADAPVPAAAP